MTTRKCVKADCTVTETGTCLELHADPKDCPHFRIEEVHGAPTPDSTTPTTGKPIQPGSGQRTRRFHGGFELGSQDALNIMRGRYAYFIAVLGFYNAGKTCFLTSLYLLPSSGELAPNYMFAGSLTLPGFESRARGLRKWTGDSLPDKLVEHTHLSDDRNAGLLHLALEAKGSEKRRLDFLFTDLPGEWSKDLVERADTAHRFQFLRRADGLIIVVDGPLLLAPETRHNELHKAKLLLSRISDTLAIPTDIPLVLLVSKADLLDMRTPEALQSLHIHAERLGFHPETILSAAISTKPHKIRNGTGVMETLETLLNHMTTPSAQFCQPPTMPSSGRVFQRFPF